MENLFDGSLLSYANKNGPMKEEDAAVIFSELIIALRYLHDECNIAHRDIKAENILLDENHNIRLIDFGISRIHDIETEYMKTNCGSILYAAPEIISEKGYTKSVDIWSAGVLLYAIVVGHFPFEENNYKNLTHKIVYSNVEYPPCLSILLTDLLQKMLVKDPTQRITIKEILDHPWLKKYAVNIENLLKSTKFDEKEMESQYEKYPTVDKDLLRNIVERRFYTNAIHSIRFNPHGFQPKYRSLPQIVFTYRNPISPVIPYASKIRIPSNIKKRVIIQPHITLPNVQ
ncbi:CAMK family protein kinase [Trichomonas vaginalis G3]|uniref:CAMK family protein kinase n=1 Tax=Trichomonas vaginalis (strain ATCC PRA-98 / G3) TaxID=412133 RepID=A2DGV6_TRIV3|nr:protein serine/threonine kinase protein [Trichomonas vaginalis G3]EAY20266.1 CAMK family protein kinase [Trichomonas vaginalis G3]KAI5529138.1 protein serine/threonine kinase protein [Trichomonas vaginalis G3]|eukprot:XP_001581252.1 CAMK family protein kinase [Trichomonas vaginalis G3]